MAGRSASDASPCRRALRRLYALKAESLQSAPGSQHHEPPEPEAPERQPAGDETRRRGSPSAGAASLWIALIAAVLALVAFFVVRHFDEYLRRTLEAKINQQLHGYHVTLGHAHFEPWSAWR